MKEINLDEQKPEVSVIVPVYNGEKFLGQCLNSIVTQEMKPHGYEIIVVDDGSVDKTKGVVDNFSFFRNLKYFKKENGGTGSALNFGHEKAQCKYITWCSHDNIYFPQWLRVLYSAIKKCEQSGQNVELVYSDFCFMREDGVRIKDVIHEKPQSGKDLIEGYDVGMSFMYTKNIWEKAGPYWGRICEDFRFVVEAARYTNFGLVNSVLAAFRVHGQQISGHRAAEEKAAANECKRLAKEYFCEHK